MTSKYCMFKMQHGLISVAGFLAVAMHVLDFVVHVCGLADISTICVCFMCAFWVHVCVYSNANLLT